MASHPLTLFLVYILSGNLSPTFTQAEPLKGMTVTRVKDTGKYSHVVSIASNNDQYPEEQMHICTAVLISKLFILTAAHCFNGWSLDEIQIIIGSVDLRQGLKYNVSMWITYNQWLQSNNYIVGQDDLNEIAMIKLTNEVSSRVAKPASLSPKKIKDLYYHHVQLIGWGKTLVENSTYPSRYLHKVKVKVLPNAICEQMSTVFYENKSQLDKYLCTKGESHAFLADGDSGGPVMKGGLVVGISIGACPKYGQCDLPAESFGNYKFNVHIGIEFYRNFISDVLKNY